MRIPALFAPMLRERSICAGLFGAAIILVAANMLGYSIWPCAFHKMTGMPCPGCGLTRGMSALVRGEPVKAYAWNAFTPVFASAAALMLVTHLLPASARGRIVAWVAQVERRTAFSWIVLTAFLVYGFWRMFACPRWPEAVGG